MDILALLPPEVSQVLVSLVALVTALRVFAVMLQKIATRTDGTADDEAAARIIGALSWIERALDWVSVGPTARKR